MSNNHRAIVAAMVGAFLGFVAGLLVATVTMSGATVDGAAHVRLVSAHTADAVTIPQCERIHNRYVAAENAGQDRRAALALVRGVATGCFVQMERASWLWALDMLDAGRVAGEGR